MSLRIYPFFLGSPTQWHKTICNIINILLWFSVYQQCVLLLSTFYFGTIAQLFPLFIRVYLRVYQTYLFLRVRSWFYLYFVLSCQIMSVLFISVLTFIIYFIVCVFNLLFIFLFLQRKGQIIYLNVLLFLCVCFFLGLLFETTQQCPGIL